VTEPVLKKAAPHASGALSPRQPADFTTDTLFD